MTFEPTSPHTLNETEHRRVFWADAVADAIEARDSEGPVVIKGGISPSGVPHLGNMNEVLRGYFVAEVLRERGHEVRQVFTADDRDPLRKLPRTLADAEGNLVDLGEVDAGALGRNLGHPYTAIPDPFGEAASYGAHFTNLIERSAELLGVPIEVVSTTELYESGEFDDVVRHVLKHREEARSILGNYQDKVDEDYVPFNPVCESCGKITETVLSVDLGTETVEYECTDMTAGDRVIEGCGHRGTAAFRGGKLPWRFEWPAQWQVLDVDFEPFGKDHAEGSWVSGEHIAEELLGIDAPLPMVYEWFTLDGEPFSSSEGNVVLVSEVLELAEPEVLRYFFAKDPKKARDFSIRRLDRLVDEFDRVERLYFGEEEGTEKETTLAERVYPFLVDEVREGRVRIPYTYAAVLGMTDEPELRVTMAERAGHLPADAPEWARETAFERVELARTWAERIDNEYNYELAESLPGVEFDADVEAALDDLAGFIEREDPDDETLQGEIYETARRHDVDVGEFFTAGYRLFLDTAEGPRLGPFLAALDRAFVLQRLRREA
ncbi:MAG: lysine--tRNA ligase [Haloarculaceae archaeon]